MTDKTSSEQLQALKQIAERYDELRTDAWNATVARDMHRALYEEIVPIPTHLTCPLCGKQHVDEGEWATRLHKTHLCLTCGHEWRPYPYPTVGVMLPGVQEALEDAAKTVDRYMGDVRTESYAVFGRFIAAQIRTLRTTRPGLASNFGVPYGAPSATGYPKAADGCCHKTVQRRCSDCPFWGDTK